MVLWHSHRDETLRDELEVHLKLLQRQGFLDAWHDCKILAGQLWGNEISRHLQYSKIMLFLVSDDCMASDYIWSKRRPGRWNCISWVRPLSCCLLSEHVIGKTRHSRKLKNCRRT